MTRYFWVWFVAMFFSFNAFAETSSNPLDEAGWSNLSEKQKSEVLKTV